jgi:chromosomal replication initiator protein
MTNNELWKSVLREIEMEISKANFVTWFKNTNISTKQDGKILVAVPNAFTKEWMEYKYNKTILKSLLNHDKEIRSVNYVIAPGILSQIQQKTVAPQQTNTVQATETQMEFKEFQVDKETGLNPRYAFNTFIVGSFNEMANAAGLAVTKNVGKLYNPLMIYGGVGLGKTHLIQSIGNAIRQNNPAMKVKYLTSEKYTSEFVSALQNNEVTSFKNKYRRYDVLIVDDVQFFSAKGKVQEEFFHTFNALYDEEKQIILSADRPPKSISDLEERLRSRFEGGMIADISAPEYESRLAILRTKAENKKYVPPVEVLEYIAATIQSNIRELEGALNAVIAKEGFIGRPLSIDEVKEVLSKNSKPKKLITAAQIIKTVADFYNIDERSLFEKTRKKEIVRPRQVAMYLLREDFNGSYPYIGQKFGGRDHTTAIHSYEKISKDLKKSELLTEEVKKIREILYTI